MFFDFKASGESLAGLGPGLGTLAAASAGAGPGAIQMAGGERGIHRGGTGGGHRAHGARAGRPIAPLENVFVLAGRLGMVVQLLGNPGEMPTAKRLGHDLGKPWTAPGQASY